MKRKSRIILVILSIILLIILGTQNQEEMGSDFLNTELVAIENYLEYTDSINPEVSQASVAWHLDHILLVINGIYQRMDSSDVKDYESSFSFSRSLVFTTNQIPRGRAESPKSVKPKENVSIDSIRSHIKLAQETVLKFSSLEENAFFEHPYFGKLNRKQAKKFLKIHTNHHLKIIKDILKK